MNAGMGAGDRIRDQLRRRAWTQQALADEIGLTKDKLTKSLNGVRHFTVGELLAISQVLNVDMDWLADGTLDPAAPRTVYRHGYAPDDATPRLPAPAERAALDAVEGAWLLADTEPSGAFERFAREVGAAPDPTVEQVRTCARAVARRWSTWRAEGHDPVLDLPDFFTDVGVDLVVLQAPMTPRVQTYAMVVRGHRIIAVHSTAAWYSAVFGIFHELAHLLFSHDTIAPDTEPRVAEENAANWFAADVLMPYGDVTALTGGADAAAVAAFCWAHAVGSGALATRAQTVKSPVVVPPQRQLTALWRDAHGADERRRSAEWRSPRFPAWLVERHTDLVGRGVIPPDLLAWMTSTPVEDLDAPPVPTLAAHDDAFAALGL